MTKNGHNPGYFKSGPTTGPNAKHLFWHNPNCYLIIYRWLGQKPKTVFLMRTGHKSGWWWLSRTKAENRCAKPLDGRLLSLGSGRQLILPRNEKKVPRILYATIKIICNHQTRMNLSSNPRKRNNKTNMFVLFWTMEAKKSFRPGAVECFLLAQNCRAWC